jgi:DNA polymerase-1
MPITGITKSVVMDGPAVEEKYGVKPSQFIDYKALVGDQSDGYPGVAGIGPKTAAGLLQQFGSLENLYTHLGDLKPEIAQKLATDAEQCALAKQLATIHTDAPVHLELEKAEVSHFTKEKFLGIFDNFGFNSLKKRLLKEESNETHEPKEPKGSPQKNSNTKKEIKNEDQLELL